MRHEILTYNKTKRRIPEKLIKLVILGALGFLKLKQPVELAVLIVGAEEIKSLNKIWRKKDYAPDELSFGLNSRPPVGETNLPAGRQEFAKKQNRVLELGEIVLNVACLPAGKDKISDKNNLARILVHGLLHLLGYNHEKSKAEALKMEHLERKILKYLNTKY